MLTASLKVVFAVSFLLYFLCFPTGLDAIISVISLKKKKKNGDASPTADYLSDRTSQTSALTLITRRSFIGERKYGCQGLWGQEKRADLFYLPLHTHQCNDDKTGC